MYDDNSDEIQRTGYDENEKRGLPSWEIGLLIAVVFVVILVLAMLVSSLASVRH